MRDCDVCGRNFCIDSCGELIPNVSQRCASCLEEPSPIDFTEGQDSGVPGWLWFTRKSTSGEATDGEASCGTGAGHPAETLRCGFCLERVPPPNMECVRCHARLHGFCIAGHDDFCWAEDDLNRSRATVPSDHNGLAEADSVVPWRSVVMTAEMPAQELQLQEECFTDKVSGKDDRTGEHSACSDATTQGKSYIGPAPEMHVGEVLEERNLVAKGQRKAREERSPSKPPKPAK